jgi:hypothetical protein
MTMWLEVSVSGTGGAMTEAQLTTFTEDHGVPLPEALASLYRSVGVGSFGDFLHFVAPHHMSTHRELIGHLLDEAGEKLIAPTADVIVFAQSDNGDMCGWHKAALAAGDDRVVHLDGFDEEPLTDSTERFLAGLPHNDYFGVGILPTTYTRHDWL